MMLQVPTLPPSSDNQITIRQWMHVMVKTISMQSEQSGMHATMEKYKLYHRLYKQDLMQQTAYSQ